MCCTLTSVIFNNLDLTIKFNYETLERMKVSKVKGFYVIHNQDLIPGYFGFVMSYVTNILAFLMPKGRNHPANILTLFQRSLQVDIALRCGKSQSTLEFTTSSNIKSTFFISMLLWAALDNVKTRHFQHRVSKLWATLKRRCEYYHFQKKNLE